MRPPDEPGGREADEDAFDAFYAANVGRLIGRMYVLTGDLAEAQDVVQEAFARAWERWAELDMNGAPEAWVRTVAQRLAVSRWRRMRTALAFVRRQGPPPTAAPPDPHHVLLVQALREIPEAHRRVVVLHYLCDMTVEQVAAETGRPVGTVKSQLSRGRAALARLLDDTEPDPRATRRSEERHA